MARPPLPIGIQTFRKIREGNCYYVDKTGYALRLFREGTHFFLSRPRRFGKCLFLDTLKELFQGNQSLFVGLEAHDRWDWSVSFPVVHLDFGGLNATRPGDLEEDVLAQLRERDYAAKYRHLGLPIHLVGVEFDTRTRNVGAFESALA